MFYALYTYNVLHNKYSFKKFHSKISLIALFWTFPYEQWPFTWSPEKIYVFNLYMPVTFHAKIQRHVSCSLRYYKGK